MREQLFACEPNFILGYLDRLENASEEELKLAASMFDPEEKDPEDDLYEEDGDEARITIGGLLTMAGPSPLDRLFGDTVTAYKAIQSACNRAAASPCKSVTFAINSPGGEVNGCDQTWQAIRALAKSKECTAENNGMMASAAYWLASACPRITATSPACEQGSIGVKQVLIDDSGLRDSIGLKKITIVSKNAPRKSEDPSKKADLSEMQKRCDAMEAVFVSRVAEGRGMSTEKVLADFGQGGVLVSSEARDAGMIDAIVAPRGIPTALAVPDNFSRTRLGALAAQHIPETGRKPMTLKELLASDASAKLEYDQAIQAAATAGHSAGKAEMQAVAEKVGKYLTSEVYSKSKAIVERALSAISGKASVETVEAAVSMFDLMAEQKKQDQAAAETIATGETPAQKLSADAAVIAKAQALKIDVAAVQAAAKAQGLEPMKALAAAIEGAEQLAKDKLAMGPTGTGA